MSYYNNKLTELKLNYESNLMDIKKKMGNCEIYENEISEKIDIEKDKINRLKTLIGNIENMFFEICKKTMKF